MIRKIRANDQISFQIYFTKMKIFGKINKISKFHNDLESDEKYHRKNTKWITFFLIKYSAHLLLIKEDKRVIERHGKKLSSWMLKNKLGMVLWKKTQKTITNMSKWDLLSSDIGTLNLGLRSSIAARLVESKVIVDMEGSAIKSKRKSHQEWIMKATNWDSIVYLYN